MNKALALLLCGLPLAASAQIYKWTDANGQVHFSQNPPKTGSFTDVTPQLPVSGATTGGSSTPRPAAGGRSPSSPAAPSQQALQASADRAERCAKANERISFLEEKTARRLFITGDDGQPARMNQEQFEQEMKDARDAAAKYCDAN